MDKEKLDNYLFAQELLELDLSSLRKRLWGFTTEYEKRRWLIKGLNVFAFCAIMNHWRSDPQCTGKEAKPDLIYFALQLLITEKSWFMTRSVAAYLNSHAMVNNLEKVLFWDDSSFSASSLFLKSALNIANVFDGVDTWVGQKP